MALLRGRSKLYPLFTFLGRQCRRGGKWFAALKWGGAPMIGVAIALFIAVFGWGADYFGWSDPDGKVQLALAATFILGAITGFKGKS
jgi:hypothetical protein